MLFSEFSDKSGGIKRREGFDSVTFDHVVREYQCTIDFLRFAEFVQCIYSSTHKGYTQMEYPFVYATGLYSTSFSRYCTTQGEGHTGNVGGGGGDCLYLHLWGW